MTAAERAAERAAEDRRRALANADAAMAEAKAKFSVAALSCLRGELSAEQQVRDALAEVDAARAALRNLGERT
jgi:hypothetical protein